MTPLGIVAALAAEARVLGLRRSRHSQVHMLSQRVMICVSGIGRARARAAAERLLAHGAGALLSWGTAAALDGALVPGQVLLPRRVLRDDLEPGTVTLDWQRQLYRKLHQRFAINEEPLIETGHLLVEAAQKNRLHVESGAVAADMESAELSVVARDAGVPFAVLRTVADTASAAIPHWTTRGIDHFGQLRSASMLLPLIMHPDDWPGVLALARDFRAALGTLRAVANGNDAGLRLLMPGDEAVLNG